MPAPYGIHTSTTKFILLIEYNVEQLAGHCVIMIDIAVYLSCNISSIGKTFMQRRRKIARLLLLYKALYDHIALQIPPYYTLSYSNTRANHQFSFIHPSTRTKLISICTVYIHKLSNNGIVFHQIWHQLSPHAAEFHKLITKK